MAQELSDRQALGQIDAESALRWLYSVRSDLQAEAERCESDLRQLASTLLVAVVGESCAAFFQIGDGAIVVLDNGHYRHVFWPQSGEYANTTNFVTDPTFHECLAFEYRDARVDEVALFTDGLQLVALDYKQKSTHEPFFSPMFETLRKSSSAEELRVPMRSFLQSSRLNERTDDDKTLILATRVHDNGRAL